MDDDSSGRQTTTTRSHGEPVWLVQLAAIGALIYFVRLEALNDFSVDPLVWGILAVAILGPERASHWLAHIRGR